MQVLSFFLFAILAVLVSGQTDLVTDPGLVTLERDQCSDQVPWHFRSDFRWNDTQLSFDAQCEASLEIPTDPVPGLTKGLQTNINKALIPFLPTVTGGEYPESAGVVDMNAPCRSALWYPFTLVNNSATVTVQLKMWVRSNEDIQQLLGPDTLVDDSPLLQYLREPNGVIGNVGGAFSESEIVNMFRVDIMLPEEDGGFYNRAFSVIDEQIAHNIPIPGFVDGMVTPATGTSGAWIEFSEDISLSVATAGTYALRVAASQSAIGVSWGISDVHIMTQGGVDPAEDAVIADVVIENTQKTIGGTVVFSKTENL